MAHGSCCAFHLGFRAGARGLQTSQKSSRTCSAVGPAGADGRSCRGRVLGHGAGAAANHELLAHHVDPTVSAAVPSVLILCTSRPLLASIGGATTCCTSDAAIAPVVSGNARKDAESASETGELRCPHSRYTQ